MCLTSAEDLVDDPDDEAPIGRVPEGKEAF
jgi:hypothetical protein